MRAARTSSSTRPARGRPITAALGGLPQARVRVRPGKGIHVVLDRRLSNYGVVSEAIDGRQIFLEPWQNVSIVGTTDDDYYGDLDDVRATSEEVRYLVQGVARVFPQRARGARHRHVRGRAAHALRLRAERGRPLARARRSSTTRPTARRASTR